MSRGRYEYRVKEIRWLFWIAVGCFAAHAISYLLMPAAMRTFENGESKGLLLVVGCLFWLPLLVGYSLVILANSKRKVFIRARLNGDISMQCRVGAVTFFSNTPAIIADAALLSGSIALVIIYFCDVTSRYIAYAMLAIVSFSLNAHGLFNGRIYRTVKYKKQEMRRDEDHE